LSDTTHQYYHVDNYHDIEPTKRYRHGRPHALGKVCKVFCALVMTVRRSADELFMHFFSKHSSASGDFAPRPHISRLSPNLSTPEKKILRRSWLPYTLQHHSTAHIHCRPIVYVGL